MNQATLFDNLPASVPEWRGIPGLFGTKRNGAWVHRSGVIVRHCGHPTALRPYYIDGHPEFGCLYGLERAKAVAVAGSLSALDSMP